MVAGGAGDTAAAAAGVERGAVPVGVAVALGNIAGVAVAGGMIGAEASLGPVIDFPDAAIFAMAVVNIPALYVLMPIVRSDLESYLVQLKAGAIRRFRQTGPGSARGARRACARPPCS